MVFALQLPSMVARPVAMGIQSAVPKPAQYRGCAQGPYRLPASQHRGMNAVYTKDSDTIQAILDVIN